MIADGTTGEPVPVELFVGVLRAGSYVYTKGVCSEPGKDGGKS